MTTRRLICAVLACLVLAALSLRVADEPVYDAWAWLVWGRELAQLELEMTSGPAWKPLPVLLAAPLSLAGDAAPQLWLVVVRAAWLMAIVLAAQLSLMLTAGRPQAARLAGAAFAAVGIVLLADEVTPWSRQVAGGMAEPLLVALVLGAVCAAVAGRPRAALALGALAALARPEVFALLALYALWCRRSEPGTRPLALGVALAVPALWLLPELLADGGGSAGRAQTATSEPLEALGWAVTAPLAVAWPLALAALHDRRARVLAAGAAGLVALVAAMTLAGFAGLPRFTAPAAALVGVLGGAGLAALLARRARPRGIVALSAAALALTALGLPARVAEVPDGWRTAARDSASHDRLRAMAGAVGRERLLACGRLATSDTLVRTALAWRLGVPLSHVVSFGDPPRLSGAFVVDVDARPRLREVMRAVAAQVARNGEWRIYSIDCPATASSSPPARSAGVTGATR